MNTHTQPHPWQSRIAAFVRSLPDSGRRKRWRVIARLAASSVPTDTRHGRPYAGGRNAQNVHPGTDEER
jgi:hypothetical protein